MTKKEKAEVLSILSELQAKVRAQKQVSATNQRAAITRTQTHPNRVEASWIRHWTSKLIAGETVDDMLGRLIEEQNQCQTEE
jgi:hypothetical protein